MTTLESISFDDILAAKERIKDVVNPSPLIRFNMKDTSAEIYLKLESLQPIGSFKLRGACNAMKLVGPDKLAQGVYTASMGNMAQGVAWNAAKLGIPCSVVVPDNAPETKLDAIKRLGGKIEKVTFNEWWQVLLDQKYEGFSGHFIHPVSDPTVIAGHGTIGLEILDAVPDIDTIIIP